jgi:hypothetical protein
MSDFNPQVNLNDPERKDNPGQSAPTQPAIPAVVDPSLLLTKEEGELVAKLMEKMIQRALVNAIADVVTPALRQSFASTLIEAATAVQGRKGKPGGGQDGGGSSQTTKSDTGG